MASKAGKWMGNSSAEWVCECRAYRTLVPVDLCYCHKEITFCLIRKEDEERQSKPESWQSLWACLWVWLEDPSQGVHGLPSPVTPSGALTWWNCPASLKSPSQRGQLHSPPMLFQAEISGTSGKCPARQGGARGPGLDSPQPSPELCTGTWWQKPQVEPTGQCDGETHPRHQGLFSVGIPGMQMAGAMNYYPSNTSGGFGLRKPAEQLSSERAP